MGMEMHAVFYKNELTFAQETAAAAAGAAVATPTGANGGYGRAVIAATTTPVDPAGVAVVAYQIDVGASNPELSILTTAMTDQNTAAAVVANSNTFYTTADNTAASTSLTPSATANVNMSVLMMLDDGALEDYYFYDGSLTAPSNDAGVAATRSCAEIVRWIIPTQRLTMTAAEMAAFNLNNN